MLAIFSIAIIAVACNKQEAAPELTPTTKTVKSRQASPNYYVPDPPTWECPQEGGNCIKPVVIKGDKLKELFDNEDVIAINTHFGSNTWQDDFTGSIINDADFRALMRSPNLIVKRNTTSNSIDVYLLGTTENMTVETANYVLPL